MRKSVFVQAVFVLSALSAAALAQPEEQPMKKEGKMQFDLVRDKKAASIVLAKTEAKGVHRAAKDLQRDITKITAYTPNIVHSLAGAGKKCVVIASADSAEGKALLETIGVSTSDLDGKWECFEYRVLNNVAGKEQVLAIVGSNMRGTIFGIYDFEQRHMGVDPFWFWADHEPPTQGELVYDERIAFGPTKEPTWKYRGWTLNDHPQLIEWMETGLIKRARYGRYMFSIHHEVFDRLWEAALRLKMNMFAWYFVDADWQPDRERLQAAVDRGLFITQHQMEGIGADSGYWNEYWDNYNPKGKPKVFSHREHPEAFREFWTHYIKTWAQFSPNVVWELNLRGWADGPYTEPTLPDGGTPQQRAEIISEAIADQAGLVRRYDPNPDLEMMTTLYAEVGRAYDEGWINVPKGVTTGFADAGMNGMSYSKTFWTERRDPERKYGQYFHTQYFGGGPQIAKCTHIEKYLKVNMDAMHQRGDTHHMLLAMNELRHQQIEVRAIAEMLWDYPTFKPREYMLKYCIDEFGEEAGPKVLDLYDEYYEKYPHKMIDDGFKTYTMYYKVMEPLFTVIANLNNILNGNRDGVAMSYRYDRKVYEEGIGDLGRVLDHARALRASIPVDRKYFFDYEFIDAIRLIRGIYKLSIATQDAIERLKEKDSKAALAALLDAKPLTDDLYDAFQHTKSTDKWKYWYRSGTNEDFYLLYNLYQKARLKLETECFDFVADIEPQRRPYMGNPVMHDFTRQGDIVYCAQSERLNGAVWNGAPYSFASFPLEGVFQIRGVIGVYSKWKEFVTDYGLAYRFRLKGDATVYVAAYEKQALDWLAGQGFKNTGKTLVVGHWGWPYRYQHRPPDQTYTYTIYARDFPAGEVVLGKTLPKKKGLPYIVLVKPSLLAFENFHRETIGAPPARWKIEEHGGAVTVVDNPDYDAELRPSVFDLASVPRYTPLDLKGLKLQTTRQSTAAPSAELGFLAPVLGDFVVCVRAKPGQADRRTGFSLATPDGTAPIAIHFSDNGRITCQGADGKDVDIAPYESGRWYNVIVTVRPNRRQFLVTVQDDRLNVASTGGIEAASPVGGALAGIRLTHSNDTFGSWVLYDAIAAHHVGPE